METKKILDINKDTYQDLYAKKEAFLRYPGDWVVRFHNMYLKNEVPSGRVLDYGCGSGNNSLVFLDKGYEVHGVDVAENMPELVKLNLEFRHLDPEHVKNFKVIKPDFERLPYADGYFDFIISNQVLYYLGSEDHIRRVVKELHRCLRPGGVVFFTMLGPRSYYILHHTKAIHNERVYEVKFDDPSHRLFGLHEMIWLVRDEEDLKRLFNAFECVTTGFFEQKMFDMCSNHHWIFVGKKK